MNSLILGLMPELARASGESSSEEFFDELPEQHVIVRGMLVRKATPGFERGDVQQELAGALRPYNVRRGGRPALMMRPLTVARPRLPRVAST